ncbi:hypothetical protein JAAARDRAFT_152482 [Jaapia argillacea MUCL 33604]|uniref:Cytochrome P450 n=1 Tax=Jaapia argillacea MUCL 33604 TaxID=933084 RepID=A0A067QFC3_9AGAM|nr:hypothetical protein JAAARDRAFT_152482 [Jaapia argillacea MUCL 33604]
MASSLFESFILTDFGLFAVALISAALLYYATVRQRLRANGGSSTESTQLPYPPGPSAYLPIVGNILSVPREAQWEVFTKCKHQYGDLVYFHGLGTRILVLNSMKAINDLFDKRAHIYSHRPVFTVVGELMGLGQSMPLLPYGKEWREHRKLAHVALSPTAVKKYHGIQEDLAASMMKDFLEKPKDFFEHVRLTAGRIVLTVTYGISVGTADDEYITHAEETMEIIGKATVPGAFLCDLLPFLKYLPSWIPFQQEASRGKKMIEHLVTMPFEHVKQKMVDGTAEPSLTQDLLSLEKEDPANFEHRVKWTTGAMYGAGGETTYATVLTFMMAMALHPDIQKRAQLEIDSIVGLENVPSVSDTGRLPYVNAVIKEVMRWHPVLPLSIARRSAKDDIYEGYSIPEGTILIPNVWAVALEPNIKYPSDQFIPDRFLDPSQSGIDPATWAFGFGRRFTFITHIYELLTHAFYCLFGRICPGKHLGENSVFILIAHILAFFDILPPSDGVLIPAFSTRLVSYPEKFECRIIPRSEQKADLIRQRASHCKI